MFYTIEMCQHMEQDQLQLARFDTVKHQLYSADALLQVDIDLTQEGDAKKVSRQQAQLALHADGQFLLTNIGRRTVCVNGAQVVQHRSIKLDHLNLLDLAGIRLLFVVNHLAVHRMVARSQNLVL